MECDLVQGYYFSRPVSATEVPDMARRGFKEKVLELRSATDVAAAAR